MVMARTKHGAVRDVICSPAQHIGTQTLPRLHDAMRTHGAEEVKFQVPLAAAKLLRCAWG
jgi:hypothetical protein